MKTITTKEQTQGIIHISLSCAYCIQQYNLDRYKDKSEEPCKALRNSEKDTNVQVHLK